MNALRTEALRRGLLHRYDFSGTVAYGISRNDAITELLAQVRHQAFALLYAEFGRDAECRKSPALGVDVWWPKAHLALRIIGPLRDDTAGPTSRRQNDRSSLFRDAEGLEDDAVITFRVPYYLITKTPRKFIELVRTHLVSSGAYPRLCTHTH